MKNLIRTALVCLALLLLSGELFAGQLARLRDRREGGRCGRAAQTCTPSYAPSAVHGAVKVPEGGCPGGTCRLK